MLLNDSEEPQTPSDVAKYFGGESPYCADNDVFCAFLVLDSKFKTPPGVQNLEGIGFSDEFREFQISKLQSLKSDMEKARLLPGLADAIDTADNKIATITEQKTIADGKKSELVDKYYKSGKKEDK